MRTISSLVAWNLLFAFLCLPVTAQYAGGGLSQTISASVSAETDSGSACTSGNIHHVTVGQGGNQFDPSIIFAHPGDIVIFTFYPSNHSVIQTDFTESKSETETNGNPCVPIDVLHPGTKGFFSGNKIVESFPSPGNSVTWNLTIKDRDPKWFYCDAPLSCHPNGMVGVINPNTSGSFQKQQAAAVSALFQLSPTGQATFSEGAIGATSSHSKLSAGAIAGIAIGAAAVLVLLAALFFFIGRGKSYKDLLQARSSGQQAPNAHMGSPNMPYASPYPNAPPGFRNTTFSDATTGSEMAGPYGSGWVASSPHPDNQPTQRNMSFNITAIDDISAQYGYSMPGVHPGNNVAGGMRPPTRVKSPQEIPPYELSASSTGPPENGAWTTSRYQ